MEIVPTRLDANNLLNKYITNNYLIIHSNMVAIAMGEYAKRYNEDEEIWFVTGLLHDLDYEKYPELHPSESIKWLRDLNYSEEIIHAIESHAISKPRVIPKSNMAKALIAIDELCGLIYAYSLMRPNRFDGMEAKSLIKKFKDKAFASKIDREEISYGVNLLNIDFKEHVEYVIQSLKGSDYIKTI